MESLWTKEASLPSFPRLQGEHKTQVLIVGGGIAGLLCAHRLAQAGVDYILIERQRICSGITQNTTAKITAQHGLCFHTLVRRLGRDAAKLYLLANEAAVKEYRRLCAGIDCGFENKDNFVYSAQAELLDEELEALYLLGSSAEPAKDLPIPVDNCGAVRFRNQAQFQPLQFLSHIAGGLNIYENTPLLELRGNTAIIQGGRITAEKTVIATHFPWLNKHGMFFLKLYQQRSYVLALTQVQRLDGMYIGAEKNSLSLRTYGDTLLLGGGGHRTGKTGGNWAELKSFAQAHYPGAKAVTQWATQDCMTLDGIPYIGQYSRHTPNLYVITGFNKWGMTNAMAGASLITDLILGNDNPYAEVFSPQRSIWQPQLLINAGESAWNLLRPTRRRCPHMGCALKWNAQEHSWDCPCHGSRFSAEGECLDNPATGDLQ